MKKVILAFTLFAALFLTASTVSAKGIIVYSNGEKMEEIAKLPDDAVVDNGEHVNLCVMYEQFSIFWIPMWNYGETKYVLLNDKKDTYYDLSEEGIEMLKTDFNIDVPEKPTIGFWNKIGGKLIWIAVIVVIIYSWMRSRKDNDEAEIPTENA
jgi:hypothetical protein